MRERSVFLVRCEAKPLPGSAAFAENSGAFVNVWVDAPTGAEAMDLAVSAIAEAGWAIESQVELIQSAALTTLMMRLA